MRKDTGIYLSNLNKHLVYEIVTMLNLQDKEKDRLKSYTRLTFMLCGTVIRIQVFFNCCIIQEENELNFKLILFKL